MRRMGHIPVSTSMAAKLGLASASAPTLLCGLATVSSL